MDFNQRLQSLMLERGYTMYRLAALIGCKQTTIKNWLEKDMMPQPLYFQKLTEIFDVSVEYLKGETDDREHKNTAVPKDDGLSDKDARLLAWFRSLPPEKQKEVLYDAGAPAGLV